MWTCSFASSCSSSSKFSSYVFFFSFNLSYSSSCSNSPLRFFFFIFLLLILPFWPPNSLFVACNFQPSLRQVTLIFVSILMDSLSLQHSLLFHYSVCWIMVTIMDATLPNNNNIPILTFCVYINIRLCVFIKVILKIKLPKIPFSFYKQIFFFALPIFTRRPKSRRFFFFSINLVIKKCN